MSVDNLRVSFSANTDEFVEEIDDVIKKLEALEAAAEDANASLKRLSESSIKISVDEP